MTSNNFSREDIRFMNHALYLAYLVKGTTSPNPAVGAVLVKDGKIISTGYTNPPGGYHAERMALINLKEEETRGATLYVTLEPCCFYGRTPPCTDIIIEKKIKRVVVAIRDPHPNVNGKGIEILRKNGIIVEEGLLRDKAFYINQDFFVYVQEKRPLVAIKYAMSLDGKLANLEGSSKWITNERSRKITHILRYRSDAILVGANTVINDNPKLNARLSKYRTKNLTRVVIDLEGKIKTGHVLEDDINTIFVINNQKHREKVKKHNKEFFINEAPNLDIKRLLDYLYQRNITSLFVEGGAFTISSFIKEGFLDIIFCFIGNRIIGEGLTIGESIKKGINEPPFLTDFKIKKIGDNVLIYDKVRWE